MIWLLTLPLAFVAAYSILCLAIGRDMGAEVGSGTPYWLLLAASLAILYAAWFHPVHISFA